MKTISVYSYRIDIYEPDKNAAHLVYLHADPEEGAKIWTLLCEPKPVLAVISGTDWNRDFSPWPAPGVFSKGGDFSGGAELYLASLTGAIIPAVESALYHIPRSRHIAGYSLAGLFALWCNWRTDIFDGAAALSPSVWFDGFIGFIQENVPSDRLKCVSLSLGTREMRTRNIRMATVETALQVVQDRLTTLGINTAFQWESGGHFDDISGRIARGIAHLYAFSRM